MKKSLFIIPMAALSLVSCGSTDSSSKPPLPPTNASSVITLPETEPITTESKTEATTSAPVQTVVVAGYSKQMDDNVPVLTVYYDFTNTFEEETSFVSSFADDVTQSGKPLFTIKYVDEAEISRRIQPGESVHVGIVYEVNDPSDTTPFTVTLTDLFGKTTYLEETLK